MGTKWEKGFDTSISVYLKGRINLAFRVECPPHPNFRWIEAKGQTTLRGRRGHPPAKDVARQGSHQIKGLENVIPGLLQCQEDPFTDAVASTSVKILPKPDASSYHWVCKEKHRRRYTTAYFPSRTLTWSCPVSLPSEYSSHHPLKESSLGMKCHVLCESQQSI